MKRGDYDYNHATSGSQFVVMIVIMAMAIILGLTLGLVLLTSIL